MTTNPVPDRVRAWVSDTLPENDRYTCSAATKQMCDLDVHFALHAS